MKTRADCAWTRRTAALLLGSALLGCAQWPSTSSLQTVNTRHIDDTVRLAMAATGARGLAVSVVENGQVVFTKAYRVRNASGEPLLEDTVMYGALTQNFAGAHPEGAFVLTQSSVS